VDALDEVRLGRRELEVQWSEALNVERSD